MEQGKVAATTLSQILNCLETGYFLPNLCVALPMTPRLQRAHKKGATGATCLCFANPSWPRLSCSTKVSACRRGVCFSKQGAGSSQGTRGRVIAGMLKESSRCLVLDLDLSFQHLCSTEITNAQLEAGEANGRGSAL